MSRECIAGSGVQLTEVTYFLSYPLTNYGIKVITGSQNLTLEEHFRKFPRKLRFQPWLKLNITRRYEAYTSAS